MQAVVALSASLALDHLSIQMLWPLRTSLKLRWRIELRKRRMMGAMRSLLELLVSNT